MLSLDIKTRYLVNKDFDRVVEIDYTSGGKYSWEPEELFNEWKSRFGVGVVAIDEEDYPLGFCVYDLEDRECFEIKHFVVDKLFQRSGIGTSIINKMKNKLNNRRHILSYDVPETNLNIQLFLKKMGFKAKLIKHNSGDVLRFQYEKV